MMLLRQPNIEKELHVSLLVSVGGELHCLFFSLQSVHSLFSMFSCVYYHFVQTANCFRKGK